MFERASRLKLRFDTPVGSLSVEDIWDLPLLATSKQRACLDDLAKALSRELKNDDPESFVLKRTVPNKELILKFEIVKHIIGVRLHEKEISENAQKTREKKRQILAILADKEVESLKSSSTDELKKLLESL